MTPEEEILYAHAQGYLDELKDLALENLGESEIAQAECERLRHELAHYRQPGAITLVPTGMIMTQHGEYVLRGPCNYQHIVGDSAERVYKQLSPPAAGGGDT